MLSNILNQSFPWWEGGDINIILCSYCFLCFVFLLNNLNPVTFVQSDYCWRSELISDITLIFFSIGGYYDSGKIFCLNNSLQTKLQFVYPKYCISFMCIITYSQIKNIAFVTVIVFLFRLVQSSSV